jgi:hypothetical protein
VPIRNRQELATLLSFPLHTFFTTVSPNHIGLSVSEFLAQMAAHLRPAGLRRVNSSVFVLYPDRFVFSPDGGMADALASGASILTDVEVRVLFWAPCKNVSF